MLCIRPSGVVKSALIFHNLSLNIILESVERLPKRFKNSATSLDKVKGMNEGLLVVVNFKSTSIDLVST